MTPEQLEVVRQLHAEGYALCIFSPDELEGVSTDHVEERMCEIGWDVIEFEKDKL